MIQIQFTKDNGKQHLFITTIKSAIKMLEAIKVNHPESKTDIFIDSLIEELKK